MVIDRDVFSIQGNLKNGNLKKKKRSHHHQGSSFAPMLSAEEFSRRLIPRGDVAEQKNLAAVGLDQLRGADMHNALLTAVQRCASTRFWSRGSLELRPVPAFQAQHISDLLQKRRSPDKVA
jgi:hypothetical protein